MHARPARDLIPLLRRVLLGWIVVALAAQGGTSALVKVLGPAHRHVAVAERALPAWFDPIDRLFHDIRAWRTELRQRLLPLEHPHVHPSGVVHAHGHDPVGRGMPTAAAGHAHEHAGYQRHHHSLDDPSVVAIESNATDTADAATQAASGSITLPLALPFAWALPLPPWRLLAWPSASPRRWTDAPMRASERPPRF